MRGALWRTAVVAVVMLVVATATGCVAEDPDIRVDVERLESALRGQPGVASVDPSYTPPEFGRNAYLRVTIVPRADASVDQVAAIARAVDDRLRDPAFEGVDGHGVTIRAPGGPPPPAPPARPPPGGAPVRVRGRPRQRAARALALAGEGGHAMG